MPGRRLRRENLPTEAGTGPGGVARSGAARPRPRGVDGGRVQANERPAVLGGSEGHARDHSPTEERREGGSQSASRLKATTQVSDVLTYYGAPAYFAGRWESVRCPFHDDRHASASYNDIIGKFYCHACDTRGDIFDLIQQAEGISFPEAVAFIEQVIGERGSDAR